MTVDQRPPDNMQKPGPERAQKEAAPPVKPVVKKPGFLNWVFTKDTRMGRLNRNIVRTVGWVVAVFAAGFLTVYLLLYLPLSQDYEQLSQAYGESQQQLKTVQVGFTSTQEASQRVQAVLDKTKLSNDILDINNQVLKIELALSQHDPAGAAYYLKNLQTTTVTFLPEVSKVDTDLANMLDARVKVVASELSNDPQAAQTDLEVIVKYLQTIVTRMSQ